MSSGDTTKKSKKTRTAAQRGVGSSRRSAPQVDWPRPEGLRFELPEKLTRQPPKKIAQSADVAMRPFTSTWDEYDNFFYNAMLNLNSEPTRWLEPSFINHLEWFNYLQELKDSLGLGTMPFRRYEFYPELALHFLASCRIRYEPPMDKRACNGQLFFKIDGQAHFLSFAEICETFMFDTDGVELQIPENDAAFQALWRELTNSAIYNSATSTQAEIRLPVLRVFLKLLDSTILCKMESGKMRKSNLLLLHYAIGSRFSYAAPGSEGHKINFGAIFADLLESVKFRGLEVGQKPKTESIGSLITPLLERVGIDLSSRIADTRTNLITEQNLKGKFLSGKWGAIRYSFAYPSGFRDSIRIPSPFCRVDSAEALRFLQLRAGAADPITEDIPSSSSSAPPSLGPFVPPPVGCYEEDPYRSWFVEQMSTFWEYVRGMPRCCCTRDDIIRHPPPGTRPRRSRRAPDEDSDGRLPRSRSNTQPGL